MEPDPSLVDALLAKVEQIELRSLRWGYVDGSLGEDELDSLAADIISNHNASVDPVELNEWMVDHSLLFETTDGGGIRYRSRFSEGVRLLTRLRQLFPQRSWMASAELVSDYRVDARPRRVPLRDYSLQHCLQEFSGIPGWGAWSNEVAEALIGSRQLSGFQVRATQTILRASGHDTGTVLTAGTGSGKTLGFYLPAVFELAKLIQPGQFWTKAVAIFPRIELLKDQFTQAHAIVSPLVKLLQNKGLRPFLIGTFFSGTPLDYTTAAVQRAGWKQTPRGFVCPFLICLQCGNPLTWLIENLEAHDEVLSCADGCNAEVNSDQIVLTRVRAQREPPDITFTTAEMINQRLSDTANRHVLGIASDRARRARFILLDEIHTYNGISGAQTGLVLRRWRQAMGGGQSVRYVGLSATLEDAPRFFSELTGLWPANVSEVSPRQEEFVSESMEYQVILRGDPASRTTLLSTTIQASFLMARLLDKAPPESISQQRYGSKVFAFTDDLDATNRLFDFLRDAEGRDIFGHPDGARQPLAALRSADHGNQALQNRAGQNWEGLEPLGRTLTQKLAIGRTSSQDRGVDLNADIIVATAALEVGFNDPTVGAVIQHKSPRQLSTFVQRKGRAGRIQTMRPWTVTVLSDYGRDRLTYQAYDSLFEPILKPQSLPVRNRHVLRMQAAFALIDWLAVTNRDLAGWWWQPIKGPVERDGLWRKQQRRSAEILNEVMDGSSSKRQDLRDHIHRALKLDSQEDADEILWGSPRSLLLEVVPTLARRLATEWKLNPSLAGTASTDLMSSGAPHPLPDFLPGNLFSDLNLPEVTVVLPPATRLHSEHLESMPIAQALSRLAPGRVTRRFAPERGGLNHWIRVPVAEGEYLLSIDDYAEQNEFVASIPINLDGEVTEIPCYRPWTVRMEAIGDREVSPTSNGWQQWRTQLIPQGTPIPLSTSHDPRWGEVISQIDFHMHSFHAPVTARRFALEAVSSVKTPPPTRGEFNVTTRYTTADGETAAIGFEQDVDAVRVALQFPTPAELLRRAENAQSLPMWKSAYFRDIVLDDRELSSLCNWFQRDWLQQMMLTAMVEAAVSSGEDLSGALIAVVEDGLCGILRDVAVRIFSMELAPSDQDDELPTDDHEIPHNNQLDQRWDDLFANDLIMDRLATLSRALIDQDPDSWGNWLRDRTWETLGEALLTAAYNASPTHLSEDSLMLDLTRGTPEYDAHLNSELWLTEAALGGFGAVEALAQEATQDPRKLLRSLDAVVAISDTELNALGLEAFVELIVADATVADSVREIRGLNGHEDRIKGVATLFATLTAKGIVVDQSFKIAVNHRILREGTGPDSDLLLRDLVAEWRAIEERLSISIDLRIFSQIMSGHDEFGPRIRKVVGSNTPLEMTGSEVAGVLSGLMWARTGEVRGRAFQSYAQFRTPGHTDPSLVRELILAESRRSVRYNNNGWQEEFEESLASIGTVRLEASPEYESAVHDEIFRILATPIEVDYLQLYPVITEISRELGTTITFVLREMY
jgi:hypothetical protein